MGKAKKTPKQTWTIGGGLALKKSSKNIAGRQQQQIFARKGELVQALAQKEYRVKGILPVNFKSIEQPQKQQSKLLKTNRENPFISIIKLS